MESFGTIYKLTNMVNGKLYVGQTDSTLEKRWSKHVRTAKLGSPFALSRAIRKYGPEKFKSEIIETVEIANLSNREIFWIKELNSKCFDSGHGYNMTDGGEGTRGYVMSDKGKEIRRIKSTGKKHTQESKDLMSRNMKGRVVSWGNKVSSGMIVMMDRNPQERDRIVKQAIEASIQNKKPVEAFIGGIWVEFAGTEDLAKRIGAKAPNITNVIYGKADTIKGFQIRSKDLEIQKVAEKNRFKRKSKKHAHNKVMCLETKQIFNSRREVSTIFNVSMKSVDDSVKRGYGCRTKEYGKLHFAETI